MSSQQYLSGDLFSYTNGAYEFSVEFSILGKDSMDYGIRSGNSLRLEIPKAPQGNIHGKPRA